MHQCKAWWLLCNCKRKFCKESFQAGTPTANNHIAFLLYEINVLQKLLELLGLGLEIFIFAWFDG